VAPDKAALIDLESGQPMTYRELASRADRAANMLRGLDIGRGDRVAVLGENRPEMVELYFGAAKLGALLVPVNWRLAPEEVAYILGDAAPEVLFYGRDMEATVAALKGDSGGGEPLWKGPVLGFDDASDQGYASRMDRASVEPVVTEGIDADSPVMLLYTSGTTGRPKGAILTHGSITWNAINTATGWDLRQDDVTITHTPFFHTGGWNVLTLPLLHRGATVVMARGFDAGQTVEAIDRHGVTVLFAVPTMFQMMLDHPGLNGAELSSVRFFISGGAPCPIPLIEAFQTRGVVFKQGYGLTEVGPNCFVLDEKDAIRKAGSVGFPVLHLDTRVVDGENRPVAIGEVGELQLRGPTVCAGYWNNPEATSSSFAEGGWFKTGDLFRLDDEGYHSVVGRLKEMYISGGENVYPAEIERVLYKLPRVIEAAVVGVPHPKWGEVGHAFIAFGPGEPRLDTDRVKAHCQQHLARFKVPKEFTILDELPKGSSGKIQKTELSRLAREALEARS
jgi:fatty-acyl-CoA synthase